MSDHNQTNLLLQYWQPICWIATLIFLFLCFVVNRLLSDRRAIGEDITGLGTKIKSTEEELKRALDKYTSEFRNEFEVLNNRISQVEGTHKSWGDHGFERELGSLESRTKIAEDMVKGVRESVHSMRDAMNAMGLKLASEISEVAKSVATVATKFDTWEKAIAVLGPKHTEVLEEHSSQRG